MTRTKELTNLKITSKNLRLMTMKKIGEKSEGTLKATMRKMLKTTLSRGKSTLTRTKSTHWRLKSPMLLISNKTFSSL
jgi:hypothetical protein